VLSSDQQGPTLCQPVTRALQRRHLGPREGVLCNVIDITGLRQGAFGIAVAAASKGDRILYHVGEHCAGAHRHDARAAFEGGNVLLTMRRRDRFIFEYIAIPIVTKSA
jgi:hypothetical protein